jgi:hypothetical protein
MCDMTKYHIQPSIGFLGICLSLMVLASCTTSNYTRAIPRHRIDPGVEKNLVLPNEDHPSNLSWADLLCQVPAVSVRGQGDFLSVRIRGASSLDLTTEPLFVLNGVPLGHQFSSLARTANPRDVHLCDERP